MIQVCAYVVTQRAAQYLPITIEWLADSDSISSFTSAVRLETSLLSSNTSLPECVMITIHVAMTTVLLPWKHIAMITVLLPWKHIAMITVRVAMETHCYDYSTCCHDNIFR